MQPIAIIDHLILWSSIGVFSAAYSVLVDRKGRFFFKKNLFTYLLFSTMVPDGPTQIRISYLIGINLSKSKEACWSWAWDIFVKVMLTAPSLYLWLVLISALSCSGGVWCSIDTHPVVEAAPKSCHCGCHTNSLGLTLIQDPVQDPGRTGLFPQLLGPNGAFAR